MPAPKPLGKAELRAALVSREADDHKGTYGHALVVAGSRGMMGAAILAARGALRSGAGLVTVAAPVSSAALVAGAVPAALTLSLPESAAGTLRPESVERLKRYAAERGVSAAALGPGLSVHPDAARFCLDALAALRLPMVVDADALNALAGLGPEAASEIFKKRSHPCVLTPHPGEMSRLLKVPKEEVAERRAQCAERLARDWGSVVLLKGRGTVVSSGTRTALNPTGGPALAKGGTGDVLTGLIAGLWAQSLASGRASGDMGFAAACLGAWLHGKAGDLAAEELTPWAACAEDLPGFLPRAFAAL